MRTLIHACKTWGIWRSVQRNLLPQTLEDVDIVFNICARSGGARALTVNQLIARCMASRNTVLRRLRALIDTGIVSIRASAADGRLRELGLTRKGVRLVRKATISLRRLGAAMRTSR
jgi:DNA-binding MarR family transcriptional regulator